MPARRWRVMADLFLIHSMRSNAWKTRPATGYLLLLVLHAGRTQRRLPPALVVLGLHGCAACCTGLGMNIPSADRRGTRGFARDRFHHTTNPTIEKESGAHFCREPFYRIKIGREQQWSTPLQKYPPYAAGLPMLGGQIGGKPPAWESNFWLGVRLVMGGGQTRRVPVSST